MQEVAKHMLWSETLGMRRDSAVVLLHGFTGSHLTWARLSQRLAGNHFLIVPDLPGHGRSGATSPLEVTSMDDTSQNILGLLEHSGVHKAAILGYSLGGRIALHFALRHQELLSCLILESASPGIQDSNEREERRAKDELLARDIEQYGMNWFVDKWENQELFATQELDPETSLRVRNERLSNTASGLAMSLRSLGTGTMQPLWDDLHMIRIPVLLMVGERDEKFMKVVKEMKERITNCDLKILSNAGHSPHLESPEIFEHIVTQFIDTHDRTGEHTK